MSNKFSMQKSVHAEGTRESFGTRFGVIAAAAGSAIGLGNIWKFPYITGEYGGAAFILVYLACIAVVGLPVMLSEFIIGRKGQRNAIGAFKKLTPGTPWFLTGWMGVAAAFMILSFYSVVAGWCLDYIVKAVSGLFTGMSVEQISEVFVGHITSTWAPVGWTLGFMVLTSFVVLAGVKDGIEKYSKILMPLLLALIIVLDIRALTLPGASAGVDFLFKPDFSKINAEAVLVALGHAFFSLSLGMGTMITYGSYINKKEHLGTTAVQVTIADTVIALLAGIAIFPAVFAFGINPSDGPGLVFVTLPNVFNQMPGGSLFSILFFLLLSVAALTSTISILEVVVAYCAEELKMVRSKATLIVVTLSSFLAVLSSLSLGPLSEITLWPGKNIFDTLEYIASNFLLPLGGLVICLFMGWAYGKDRAHEELSNGGTLNVGYTNLYIFVCKYIAPILVFIVLLFSVGIIKFS